MNAPQWAEPREGDRFAAEDAQNRRLIVVPVEYVPAIRTTRGDEVDAIRVNVVDLQSEGGPRQYMGALWFGGRLIQAFKSELGKPFCGFITKEKTAGGFSAWQFRSLTTDPATMQLANQYLGQNPQFLQISEGDVRMAQAQASGPSGYGQPDPWAGAVPTAPVPAGPMPPPVQVPSPPVVPMPAQVPPSAPPAYQVPEGWGAQQVPAPPAQAPTQAPTSGGGGQLPPLDPNMSVMERLRAQRDAAASQPAHYQQPAQGQAQGQPPF